MGQSITAQHLSRLTPSAKGLVCVAADTELGAAYLSDVAWAIHYAEQNRRAMVAAVVRLLQDLFRVEVETIKKILISVRR